MKIYVMTAGAIFGLVTLAHLLRIYAEGLHLARDPWFVLLTIATAGLCAWAVRLLRTPTRS
ncbi:MAG TPA: hypothetical protein VK886_01135 [Vicinamibacterales bacterium]|nr:hypothetical protein [Vicinamibacterales bacterium]